MNLVDFHQKKQYCPSEISEDFQQEGLLEKIQGFGTEATQNQTQVVYFKQYKAGQLLVIYNEKKVEKNTVPLQYIYTQEIEQILDSLNEENSQIALKVNDSGWQFVIKNEPEKWKKTFQNLSKYYQYSKETPKRNLESSIDQYTLMKIQSEQEQNFWQQVNTNGKLIQNFLKDKNIKSIIDKSNSQAIKNRFVLASLQLQTTVRTDELKTQQKNPLKIKKISNAEDLKLIGNGPVFQMVLVTQNPGYLVDEQYEIEHQDVLKKQVLTSNFNFNTCYFYIYNDPGDNSFYRQGFDCCDLEFVHFGNKLELNLQLCNQKTIMYFQNYWQMDMVYEALKVAKLDSLNLERSSLKVLNFNIEYFYGLMEKKDKKTLKEKLTSIVSKIDNQTNIDNMISLMPKVIRQFDNFCNDFYCRQPMDSKFFTFCTYYLHKHIRSVVHQQYNNSIDTIDAKSIFELLKQIRSYFKVLEKYQIRDTNFGEWETNLTNTLVSKILQNVKKMLTKIIQNFTTDEGIEINNDKYETKSVQDLEVLIDFIWGHFKECPNMQVAILLGDCCGKLISIFLQSLIDLFKSDILKHEQIIALANNDFITMVTNLNKKIFNSTEDFFSKKQVRALIQEDFLFIKIMKIEKMSINRLKRNLLNLIEQNFEEDDFIQLNIHDIQEDVFEQFESTREKLKQPKEFESIRQRIIEIFFQSYLQKYIQACDQTRNDYLQDLNDKLIQDEDKIQNLLEKSFDDFQQQAQFTYQSLKNFQATFDIDMCLVNLINLKKFYPKLINHKTIQILLQKKICFEEDQIQFVQDFLKNSFDEQKELISKRKSYGRKIYVAYLVFKFARIFKKRLRNKFKIQSKIESAQLFKPQKNNANAPKKYSVPSSSNVVCFNTVFEQKADLEYILYSSQFDDQKTKSFLKGKLKKKDVFKKGFAIITIGGLCIYQSSLMQEEVIKIPFVLTGKVQRLAKPKKKRKKTKEEKPVDNTKEFVLFFSNSLTGVGLLFKNTNPNLIDLWEKCLSSLQQNFNISKYEIKEVDLSENCTYFKWKQIEPDFQYNFDDHNQQKMPDIDYDVFND